MKQKLLDEVIPPADGELAPPQFLKPASECQRLLTTTKPSLAGEGGVQRESPSFDVGVWGAEDSCVTLPPLPCFQRKKLPWANSTPHF